MDIKDLPLVDRDFTGDVEIVTEIDDAEKQLAERYGKRYFPELDNTEIMGNQQKEYDAS